MAKPKTWADSPSVSLSRTAGAVQSVHRALDLLFMIAASDRPLSPSQIAAELALPRSTVYRLADTLVSRGLIARKATGLVPTPKLFLLTSGGRTTLRLKDVAEPRLMHLVEITGETAGLHVRLGSLRRCVLEVEGYHGIRWARGVGFTAPLWSGAVGHVLMAGLAPREAEQIMAKADFQPRASNSIVDAAHLRRKLEAARAQGWSYSISETVEGAAAVAAPIRLNERTVASINLYAPADRAKELRGWVPQLVQAADEASAEWTRSTTV